MTTHNLQLVYTLLCDDVRLEMGNKVSLMGVFQNIMVEKLPVSLIKFAVVNHWRGEGAHQTEVRIMSPDKQKLVVTSQPTGIEGRRQMPRFDLSDEEMRNLTDFLLWVNTIDSQDWPPNDAG